MLVISCYQVISRQVLFLYLLKMSENLWFSDFFRRYRNETMNGLKWLKDCILKLWGYSKILTRDCKKPGKPKKSKKIIFEKNQGEAGKSQWICQKIWERQGEPGGNLWIWIFILIFLRALSRSWNKSAVEEYWEVRNIHLEMFPKIHGYFKKYLKGKFIRTRYGGAWNSSKISCNFSKKETSP